MPRVRQGAVQLISRERGHSLHAEGLFDDLEVGQCIKQGIKTSADLIGLRGLPAVGHKNKSAHAV